MLTFTGFSTYRVRSIREITIDLFDMFSPKWNHTHTEAEIRKWFEDAGFSNITISGTQKQGPGAFGDKVAP
jgi:hypothetical protein